jgi:hypothetical protein
MSTRGPPSSPPLLRGKVLHATAAELMALDADRAFLMHIGTMSCVGKLRSQSAPGTSGSLVLVVSDKGHVTTQNVVTDERGAGCVLAASSGVRCL